MYIVEVVLVVFLFFNIAVAIAYGFWLIDVLLGGEDYKTRAEAIEIVARVVKRSNLESGILYDLGSSRGSFVFGVGTLCPRLTTIGIDNSILRTLFARFRRKFIKAETPPVFLTKNILRADLSKADIVFIYLPEPLLAALETKLQKELKFGALAITYRVKFPFWQPHEVYKSDFHWGKQNNIFVYQK